MCDKKEKLQGETIPLQFFFEIDGHMLFPSKLFSPHFRKAKVPVHRRKPRMTSWPYQGSRRVHEAAWSRFLFLRNEGV